MEKKRWLKRVLAEFKKTPAGRRIRIMLIPMVSVEGAQAILSDDKRIHVWPPASGAGAECEIVPGSV
jgi:hypothetical protein